MPNKKRLGFAALAEMESAMLKGALASIYQITEKPTRATAIAARQIARDVPKEIEARVRDAWLIGRATDTP